MWRLSAMPTGSLREQNNPQFSKDGEFTSQQGYGFKNTLKSVSTNSTGPEETSIFQGEHGTEWGIGGTPAVSSMALSATGQNTPTYHRV